MCTWVIFWRPSECVIATLLTRAYFAALLVVGPPHPLQSREVPNQRQGAWVARFLPHCMRQFTLPLRNRAAVSPARGAWNPRHRVARSNYRPGDRCVCPRLTPKGGGASGYARGFQRPASAGLASNNRGCLYAVKDFLCNSGHDRELSVDGCAP